MPPIVHCVRHAQAVHNLSHANHDMPDPELTALGQEQCLSLRACGDAAAPGQDRPGCFVPDTACAPHGADCIWAARQRWRPATSPATRGVNWGLEVDWSMVEPGWHFKNGKWEPSSRKLQERAKAARAWLMQRPEEEIVLVSHGCFLHFLTDDWVDSVNSHATSWANTEFRTYHFADASAEDPVMTETPGSRLRRGVEAEPLGKGERDELRESSIKTWIEWRVITDSDASRE